MRTKYEEQLKEATDNTKGKSFDDLVLLPVISYIIENEHVEDVDIAGTAAATPIIETGHDLTIPGAKLNFNFRDPNTRGWSETAVDVSKLVNKAANFYNFLHVYDNDYARLFIIDAALGHIKLQETGRNFVYVSSTLLVPKEHYILVDPT